MARMENNQQKFTFIKVKSSVLQIEAESKEEINENIYMEIFQ